MNDSSNNLIEITFNRSEEALEEARILIREGYPLGASNRIYYACF